MKKDRPIWGPLCGPSSHSIYLLPVPDGNNEKNMIKKVGWRKPLCAVFDESGFWQVFGFESQRGGPKRLSSGMTSMPVFNEMRNVPNSRDGEKS